MSDELPDPHSRAFHVVVVVFFTAVVFAPWFDLFRPAEASGPRLAELREPAPAPGPILDALTGGVDFKGLRHYPAAFEEHFNDTFGFRDWFLRGHSLVKLFAFGVSPTPRVVLGKDGWLFFTGNETIEDYRGLCPFTDEDLGRWQRMLEGRRHFLAQRGIDYVLVIVPNKEEIYGEYMPDVMETIGPRRIDQLLEHMRAHSTVDILDLRPAMFAAKADPANETMPYLKLGTHWNGSGAYAAYAALVDYLHELRPELAPPLPRDAFERVAVKGNSDSWGRAMYVDDLMKQEVIVYHRVPGGGVRTVTDTGYGSYSEHAFACRTAPPLTAMFFHDSFGALNYELLASSFERLTCYWRSDFPAQLIAEEQPDIVIEQFVQRWLISKHPTAGPKRVIDEVGFMELDQQLLRLELPGAIERLAGIEGCRIVEHVDDEGVLGARVECAGRRDLLRLPETATGTDTSIMFDLTASQKGRVSVFYALDGEDLPLRRSVFRVRFPAGRSRVHVSLDDPRVTGRLFVRTSQPIVLHAVEVRSSTVR